MHGLPITHIAPLAMAACCAPAAIALAMRLGGPPGVTEPVPVRDAPPATELFPGDLRVHVFPPLPLDRKAVSYLVWISGADGVDADRLRQWAEAIAEFGPVWISKAFSELDPDSAACAKLSVEQPGSMEHAEALQRMFARREPIAAAVLQQEADYLRTFLPEELEPTSSMESVSSRALMVRAGEAFNVGPMVSGHFAPSVLRLLHEAATDPRTSPTQAEAIRRHAIDNAPRILEQRRMTVQAYLRLICRSAVAHATSQREGRDPAPLLTPLYRPVALAIQRTAAINQEAIAALADLAPPEVAADVERTYRELAFGEMGADIFAASEVAAVAMRGLKGDDLAAAVALVEENRGTRLRMIDDLCRDFDVACGHCFERARQRDRAEGDRFLRKMMRVHDAEFRGSSETLSELRSLALRSNPNWDPGDFDRAAVAWRGSVKLRVQSMVGSGILSMIATPPQIEAAAASRGWPAGPK